MQPNTHTISFPFDELLVVNATEKMAVAAEESWNDRFLITNVAGYALKY